MFSEAADPADWRDFAGRLIAELERVKMERDLLEKVNPEAVNGHPSGVGTVHAANDASAALIQVGRLIQEA